MYIEELLQFAAGSGQYLFVRTPIITGHDLTIMTSISEQIAYGTNSLTEKQATLVVKILSKYRIELRPHVSDLDAVLDHPKWKHPFRVIPQYKRIAIVNVDEFNGLPHKKIICLAFPYDTEIVETFRSRNQNLHNLHKGVWDGDRKQWTFGLTELNVEWLGTYLLNRGFKADDEFISLFNTVSESLLDLENQLPMLVHSDAGFQLKNTHKNIPQPETADLAEALFWAREYGITVWDDELAGRLNSEVSAVTKSILSANSKKPLWVNSTATSITEFTDLLNHGGPAMVIVPGGTELPLVKQWTDFALQLGIDVSQISVMFRLPNEQSEFNQYVKTAGLNNPVDERTRLVFVSTKITKPLIKAGIRFNTVINLGYYNYMHFSMSTVVDNARNLVYYSMKEPSILKKWQPQEL